MVTIRLLRLFSAHYPAQVLAIGDRIRMLRPKYVLTDAQRPAAERLGLCQATLSKVEFGQVVKSFSGRGMLQPKRFLNDSKCPLPKRFGLFIVSLFIGEPSPQIEALGNEVVPWLQDTFTGCQRLLCKRLCILILALLYIELRQVDEGKQGIGMLGAQGLLAYDERPKEERLGLLILALSSVEHAQVIEALGSSGVL